MSVVHAPRRAACFLALLALMTGCGDAQKPKGPAGPSVIVAHPAQKEIVETDEFSGRLGAVQSVEVRARVSGYLDRVAFKAGEIVKKNDLLFVIDPRPFKIAVDQAQAQVAGARVRAATTARDLDRAQSLLATQNVSQQTFDQRQQAKLSAEADLKNAQAALDNAKLNLEFAEVRAPVDGRVGREMVTVGNLVSGGSTGSTLLTTIVSLDPIFFYFDADEASYQRYQRIEQNVKASGEASAPVELALVDEQGFPHKGKLEFIDNQFDQATGTMRARAVFQNTDLMLTPGQFGRLRMPSSARHRAILIPDGAVGTDQTDRIVYVVGEDNKATPRPVTLGPLIDGLRVVRTGLTTADWIIVKGIGTVRSGMTVSPSQMTESPAPTAAPAR